MLLCSLNESGLDIKITTECIDYLIPAYMFGLIVSYFRDDFSDRSDICIHPVPLARIYRIRTASASRTHTIVSDTVFSASSGYSNRYASISVNNQI
jgi:hypothetical protein